MLISLVLDWMHQHGWDYNTNDLNDDFVFVWIDDKRLFGVAADCVIIPNSYYDRATGFIQNDNEGPQVWYASEPDFFMKLERYINDCRGSDNRVV